MRGVVASRHQVVSTWIIEVLTITLSVLALYQFVRVQFGASPLVALSFPVILVISLGLLRDNFMNRVFGGGA